MLREYETFYVLRSDAEDVRIGKVREKVTRTITSSQGGTLLGFDDWGVQKLAYDIQKSNRGRIMVVGFCADANAVSELERELRYDDAVVRFTTRVLDDHVTDAEGRKKDFEARAEAGKQSRADAEAEERERSKRAAERDRERSARRAARRDDRDRRYESDDSDDSDDGDEEETDGE